MVLSFHVFVIYMETYQVFTRILKSLGCYGEDVNNFNKLPRYLLKYSKSLSFREFIKALENNRGKNEGAFDAFINDSFDWSLTKQGHSYWCHINDEFRHVYREYLGYYGYKSSLDAETKEAVHTFLELRGIQCVS